MYLLQVADWPVHVKTCTQYAMRAGDPDLYLSPEFRKRINENSEVVKCLKIKVKVKLHKILYLNVINKKTCACSDTLLYLLA